jgi:hypothetical protein
MSILSGLWARITGEPVLVYTLVAAALSTSISFGLQLSADQVVQLNVLSLAVLSVIVRSKVTPS